MAAPKPMILAQTKPMVTVRRFDRRFLDGAVFACEYVVERLNVLCVLVTLKDRAGQVLVLQEHVEVAGLLGCPIARGIGRAGRDPDSP